MSRIIDGKAISAAVKERIRGEVSALSARGVTVGLAVIIVCENPASKHIQIGRQYRCEKIRRKANARRLKNICCE